METFDELSAIELKRRFHLLEATTMDAVTFLPVHMGAVKTAVKNLSRKKWKWGLEILEDEHGNRDVRIENELQIIVPKEHWVAFQNMFEGAPLLGNGNSYLDLRSLLIETNEEDLEKLRHELKPALTSMVQEAPFAAVDKSIQLWRSIYGIDRRITDSKRVLLRGENTGNDVQKLFGRLIRVYGEDKGGLEMLLADVADDRPLGAYRVFNKYSHLYGERVVSSLADVTLIFEATVDMAFLVSESIYIDDVDVLDEIEQQLDDVKRVGNVLYPVGERFENSLFMRLYDLVQEYTEDDNEQENVE